MPPFLNRLAPPEHTATLLRIVVFLPSESRAELRGHFGIVRSPPRFPQPARIRLIPAVKTLVVRVIAISRTPPWLPSEWGCRDRRLSKERRSLGKVRAFA